MENVSPEERKTFTEGIFGALEEDGSLTLSDVLEKWPASIENVIVSVLDGDPATKETLKKLPWCRYMPEYFFVEPTDKAAGIRRMMDYYHADYRDAIVFGDGLNDMSMFIDEWTTVAMGNAVPELKARADLITTDVDKDGIWNACVKLGLFDA